MRKLRTLTLALACLAGTLATPAARADVLPPQSCDTKGAPCDNAGDASEPGICTAATCQRATGLGGAEGVVDFECLLCELASGGTSGAGMGDAAGTGGVAGTGEMAGVAGAIPAIGGATIAPGGNAGQMGGIGGVIGAGGTPVEPGHDDGDEGCGCSFKSLGSERSAVVLMLALGLKALRSRRRRS